MRTYERKLDGQVFNFRLSVGAQKAMEKKFGEPAMQTVLAAAMDTERMTYLLGAAANYRGNENPTTDGEEIYDLMVDDGVCGQEDFLKEACMIANASGIVRDEDAKRILSGVREYMDDVFNSFGEMGPTQTEPEKSDGS